LRVAVRTLGSGVPPDALEHLFDPFIGGERSRPDEWRVGLGLAIAKRAWSCTMGVSGLHAEPGLLVEIELPRAELRN